MPFVLLEEEAQEEEKKDPTPQKGFRLIEPEEEQVKQEPIQKKGFQFLPEDQQPPPEDEEPGFLLNSYRKFVDMHTKAMKPIYSLHKKAQELRAKDEPGSQELKEKSDYVPPKATDSPEQASMMLLSQLPINMPQTIREDMLEDIADLTKNKNLFTEEGVERMSAYVGEENARQVLLEGLPTGKPYERDISYLQAFREGQQESVSGILSGGGVKDYETLIARAESEIPFLKRQAKNISKIIGDMPAFIVGGAVASLPAGGPETPVGAVLAGSGAFATQELIENAYNEALRLIHEHPELEGKSLDTLAKLATDPEALKNIGLSTIEGGAIGALVALNPLMKVLEKTPLSKFFKVPIVKSAAAGVSEVATITTVPSILHGKIPTAEDFLDNAVLIGGMKISGAAAQKLAKWAQKGKHVSENVASLLGEKFTKQDEKRLADAKTEEEAMSIIDDIAKRKTDEELKSLEESKKVEDKPVKETKEKAPKEEQVKFPYKKGEKIPKEKLPEKVYHVTTNEPGIKESGVIRRGGKEKGGLGGIHEVVSFTADKKVAEQLKSDILFANEFYKNFKGEDSKFLKYPQLNIPENDVKATEILKKQAKKEGFEYEPLQDNMSPEDHLKWYYRLRDRETGKPNPVFQNVIDVDPSKVGIVEVSKENLPDAKAGSDTHLKEISFEKDIEISKKKPKREKLESKDKVSPEDTVEHWEKRKKDAEIRLGTEKQNLKITQEELKKMKKMPGYRGIFPSIESANRELTRIKEAIKRYETNLKRINETIDGLKKGVKPSRMRPGTFQPEQKQLVPEMGTEKDVPQKREIINVMREAFKDTPLRIGKYRTKGGRIQGFFRPSDSIIRTKEANMIETAAHEFGHKLHFMLYGDQEASIQKQRKQIFDALMPYMSELYPISRYNPHDLEGFAEFTRMYVTRPESAQELAPAFYKHFEEILKEKHPKVLDAFLQARDMYNRYLKGDPVARTSAHIVSSFDRNLWKRSGDFLKKNFNLDRMKHDWLDEAFFIKKAVAETVGIKPAQVENWISPLNAYTQARILKGWAGKAEAMLFHHTFDYNTLEPVGKSLSEILKPIKTIEERKELSAFLVSMRDSLLRKRGIKTGLDPKTSNETFHRLAPKYSRIAAELNLFQNQVLRYAVDSGLFSEAQYNQMKEANPFYVPFYRVFEEGEKRVRKQTGGETDSLQARPSIKRIFGSTREIIDPLESIVSNTFMLVQNAEKNRFGQTLSKLTQVNPRGGKYMEKVPPKMRKVFELQKEEILNEIKKEARRKDPFADITNSDEQAAELAAELLPESIERWRPEAWGPTENVVTVYFDGKPKYYETIPEIADLYKRGGMGKSFAPAFVKMLSLPARSLRAGAILNPRFIQKNAVRDLVGAFIYTKQADNAIMDAVYTPLSGLAHAIKKDALYVDWLKAGGGMATMQSIDKNATSIRKGLGNKVKPIAFMRRIGEISEEMNRLGEYAKAVEKMGTDRWQKEMAAFQSRDLSIDFAKYGYYGKAFNQIIPFWNATIQGGDKLIRTLASKDPQVLQNFLTRVTAGIVLPSLFLEAANANDPDINELDETTKDTNWLFKSPVTGEIIQIPVPFETGILFHGLTRRLYQHLVKEDPHAFDGFFGSIGDAALPGFVPAAVQPFIEIWANKDFFRNRRIIPPSKEGLVSEEQYSPFTSHTARYIARAMSYMPGIDELESNLTNPSVVDHFIKTWGAGLGHMALGIADEALEATGLQPGSKKPEDSALRRFGLDAFTKRYPQAKTRSVENFYDVWQKWNKLEKSIEAKKKKNDMPGAKRLQKEQMKLASPRIKYMQKAMRKTQDTINAIYQNPKMDPKKKRVMIDKFYLREIQQAQAFMHEIDRHQKRNKLKK